MARNWKSASTSACMAAAGLLLAACSVGEAYVLNRAAIDRDSPEFGKPYNPRNAVTVCYSKHNSTQAEVAKLAREICSASGYGVQYRETSYAICSLTSPVGAVFDCTDAEGNPVTTQTDPVTADKQQFRKPHAAGMPGQPDAPLAGFQEGGRPLGVLFGRSETPAAPR